MPLLPGMAQFEGEHAKRQPTLSPWEMQKLMGLGINMGNVLETPFEGMFAKAASPKHFDMFAKAGFQHVRIPVCWGNHMELDAPYTIKPWFMDRVEELVKSCLERGLVAVITAHHEWWIDFDDEDHHDLDIFHYKALPRFESLWEQVGDRFRHYNQHLLFGILNEPHMLTANSLNELHRVALVAIRHKNPTRIITISGKDFANPRWLMSNPKALTTPIDPQLMIEVHVTEPHGFAGKDPIHQGWGGDEDKQKVQEWVDGIELWGRARGLPVYVGEFGCSNDQSHAAGRLDWLEANWKAMRTKGFSACLWDDGEKFSIYDREKGIWEQDVLIILQRALPGMEGISMYRQGGGLGGPSEDVVTDMSRTLEHHFVRLRREMEDVNNLPELPDFDAENDREEY